MNRKAAARKEIAAVREVTEAARGGQLLSRTTETRLDGTTIVVETYAAPDWRAAAWWLERRCPKRWGQRTAG